MFGILEFCIPNFQHFLILCDIFPKGQYYLKIINTVIGSQHIWVLLLTIDPDIFQQYPFLYNISGSVLNKGVGSQHIFLPLNYYSSCSQLLDGHQKKVLRKKSVAKKKVLRKNTLPRHAPQSRSWVPGLNTNFDPYSCQPESGPRLFEIFSHSTLKNSNHSRVKNCSNQNPNGGLTTKKQRYGAAKWPLMQIQMGPRSGP